MKRFFIKKVAIVSWTHILASRKGETRIRRVGKEMKKLLAMLFMTVSSLSFAGTTSDQNHVNTQAAKQQELAVPSMPARLWKWELRILSPGNSSVKLLRLSPERTGFAVFEPWGEGDDSGEPSFDKNPGLSISVSDVIDGKAVVEIRAAGKDGNGRKFSWNIMKDLSVPTTGGSRIEIPFCPIPQMKAEAACLAVEISAGAAKE